MLRVAGVRAGYKGTNVLDGVTLQVEEGACIALVGSNGAGKTTLLRCISGLLPVSAGSIEFQGRPVQGRQAHEIAKLGLVQVPEGRSLFPHMTVLENLLIGGGCAGDARTARRQLQRVFDIFPRVRERQWQVARTLSGGERQMVAIARGVMANPRLLMLDEPSLGLAPLIVREVFAMLSRLGKEGITTLLVEQNVRLALTISDYVYVMENGRIVEHGRSSELASKESIRRAYLGR